MTVDPIVLKALWRSDFYYFVWKAFGILHPGQTFVPAPHVEAMCWQLQQVAEGRTRRLLITVPPRHLKSVCASVCSVAWMLGRDPALKVLVASYGQDLAAKHARDFRTLIDSPWYQRSFPRLRIHPKRNTEAEIMTTKGGSRKAVSLGGPVTGFGGDVLIVDDLMKAAEAQSATERQRVKDFYEQTLYSRLDDKQTGRIIAIQQRLHEDDLAGYLIDKGDYVHLNLRAIADEDETLTLNRGRFYHRRKGEPLCPDREPLSVLEEIRTQIGSFAFSAQYQQNPVPPEGNRVRWHWFGTYHERPSREAMQMVVQSWDTAATSCQSRSTAATKSRASEAWRHDQHRSQDLAPSGFAHAAAARPLVLRVRQGAAATAVPRVAAARACQPADRAGRWLSGGSPSAPRAACRRSATRAFAPMAKRHLQDRRPLPGLGADGTGSAGGALRRTHRPNTCRAAGGEGCRP